MDPALPQSHGRDEQGPVFELKDFSLRSPHELGLTGVWRGVEQGSIRHAVLLLGVDGATRRVPARPTPSRQAASQDRWQATFPFTEDPAHITRAELLVAPGFAVELPPPTARRRQGSPGVVLDVHVLEETDASSEALHSAWAQLARVEAASRAAEEAAAREHTLRTNERRRLSQQLEQARREAALAADKVERQEAAHAAQAGELEALRDQLAAANRELEEVKARRSREVEELRTANTGLRRAAEEAGDDRERLSSVVQDVRAANERLALTQRATLRELVTELETVLHEVEALAADIFEDAQVAREALRRVEDRETVATAWERLGAIAETTQEVAANTGDLRRRLRRLDPSRGRWRATSR